MRRIDAKIARTEDEAEAIRMRSEGMSTVEIAKSLGVAPSTVTRRLQRALQKLPDPNAVHYRDRLVREVQRVKRTAWRAINSDPKVVSAGRVTEQTDVAVVNASLLTVLRSIEREAKLLGLDAPNRQTVNVVDNRALDEAIAEVQRQLDLTVEAPREIGA